MKISLAGNVEHSIKVTRLRNVWGVRCFTNGILNQEIRVKDRQDISVAVAEMLRWEDKCGNISPMATASRNRFFKGDKYKGYTKPSIRVKV